MERALAAALKALGLPDRPLLVAVSGGVDSVALAHALRVLSPELGLILSIGHVNHGLRGAQAAADEAFVAELADGLGLPFASERVDPRALVAEGPSRARPTLQEAARRLRREALGRLAARLGAAHVATAHTLDDQVETVFLRLLRGTGPEGLGGIPERSPDGVLVRPLLRVSRAEILEFARSRGLAWREDPSNADPRFARSRLRTAWLPGLRAAFNPQLLRAVGDLAETQRRESEWLNSLLDREADRRFAAEPGGVLRIDAKDWDALPPALARRLARRALHRCGAGRDVTRVHLERMLGFLGRGRPGRCLELPGRLHLECDARGFRLGRAPLPPAGAC
jgi:tRNA(Ile)-lysidine synthase